MATKSDTRGLIDTLKQKIGVTDTQLDQRIEQEQLWSLAGLLGSYDKFVRKPGFDLNNADIADLKDCASKHGNQQAMYEALKKWENIILDFTYRSLLEILIGRREGALADQVCRTFIQTQASEPNNEDAVSLSPAPGRKPAVPLILRSVEPNYLVSGTSDHIKEFEKRFIDVRKIALKEITEKQVTVTDFRQTLMTMPSSITNENKNFIKSNYSLFEEAKSIESIFLHLNFYLSYIDFSLLEHIIEQFGSDSLKQDMSSYAEDMRQFRMKTLVSEALKYLPNNSDAPADYSCLTLKLNFDVKTVTLEDLETYRKRFASGFSLSQLALFLCDLQESSLLVTWLVPAALGAMISDQVQKKTSFFLQNSILQLSLEGECLYPFIEKVVSQSGSSGSVIKKVAGAGIHSQMIANEMKLTIKRGLNGLAIVVPIHLSYLTEVLTGTLRFAVYKPHDKISLTSYIQALDLVELKHHPIIVSVNGFGSGNLLHTLCCGAINIMEDIVTPLFPPIATHLADNPKIFVFVVYSAYFESHVLHSLAKVEAIWENYIVCYIACSINDVRRVTDIVQNELGSSLMPVQEIFTSISDKLLPKSTMTVIDRLKEPVYLHRHGSQESIKKPNTKSPLTSIQELLKKYALETESKKLISQQAAELESSDKR